MDSPAQLLDQLDLQWADGGSADLECLLGEVPDTELELAQELCAADLEWRWRIGHDRPIAGGDTGKLPILPRAYDYASLLGKQWDNVECRRNLLEAEWCARSVWGDAPDVDEFAAQLPMIADWNKDLAKQLGALVPLEATLTSESLKRPVTVRVNHDFVIGRQGAGEPKAPAWIETSHRLIVANAHYRVISREQLRIRRTRLREVELINVSRVTPYCYDNHQLPPGESMHLKLPFSISVGMLNITVGIEDQRIAASLEVQS